MKKNLFFSLAVALTLLICLNEALAATSNKAIALAFKVQGKVEFTRDGKSATLKFGATLDDGDMVKTGKDGLVTLLFTDDKSLLKLRESTEVTLEGKRAQDGRLAKRVSMEIGELFVKVEKQLGPLEVATPTSVASVKGTEFWVVVDEDGNTHVTTVEGLVELLSKLNGRVVEVREAQRGEVDQEGNMEVKEVPQEEQKGDPDPAGQPQGQGGGEEKSEFIEIQYEDADGNVRTLRIEYQPKEGDEGDK